MSQVRPLKKTSGRAKDSRLTTQKTDSQDKRKFYRSSDIRESELIGEEEYDDKKRKGLKEWDEEYQEFNEEDLGTDFGKP